MKFIKPREAAEILGVDLGTLVKWEQDGKINAIKTLSGQSGLGYSIVISKRDGKLFVLKRWS